MVFCFLASCATAGSLPGPKIVGTWARWSLERNEPATDGLLALEFRANTQDNSDSPEVFWDVAIEGRRIRRQGKYRIERSQGIVHSSTGSFLVSIVPITPGYPDGALVHLTNVRVDEDSRLPSGELILKCRNGLLSEFALRKEKSLPAGEVAEPADPRTQANPLIRSTELHLAQIKQDAARIADTVRSNLMVLEQGLEYNHETVRWASHDALVSLGTPAVPVLMNVLREGDQRGRELACNAMQRIGRDASVAIPLLVDLLRSDLSTANYAARALSTVGRGSSIAMEGLKNARDKHVASGGAIESAIQALEEWSKLPRESSAPPGSQPDGRSVSHPDER